MSFEDDLQTGRAYEDEVIELFSAMYDKRFRKVKKETDPAMYKNFDIIEEIPRGKTKPPFPQLITIECKWTGDKHSKSPNVVVEYLTYEDEPSGICTSLATFWVFRTGKWHLIVRREELLKAIIFDLNMPASHQRIQIKKFDHKSLLLVPIKLLENKKLCPSTTRQLSYEAMMNGKDDKNSEIN
jgi:hypothetical protein